MTWREIKVVDQRKLFIELYIENAFSLSELCRQFEISRPTAYKWLKRFEEEGLEGLQNRSRAPHRHGRRISEELSDIIINYRCQNSRLGAKKILVKLQEHYPDYKWPSASGIGNLLDQAGCLKKRKFKRRCPWIPQPPKNGIDCNDTWCADFKGYFYTSDNTKCEPFTLTDMHSRFLLKCVCLERNTEEEVWKCLSQAFLEYGLPNYFKTDNGVPFASTGVRRLSCLSVKLIKIGINPIPITPGKPQENGRHERMHLTLKQETAQPPAHTLSEQITRFTEFTKFYNFERPHEALGQKPPGHLYTPSQRAWDGKLKSPEYDSHIDVRKVRGGGTIKWQGEIIFVSTALEGEHIGLQVEEEGLALYYGPLLLGHLNEKNKLQPLKQPITA